MTVVPTSSEHEPSLVPRPRGRRETRPGYEANMNPSGQYYELFIVLCCVLVMKYILDCADAHFIANIIGLCTGKCVVDPTPIVKFFFCLSIIWKFTTSSILPAFHSCWLWGSHWPWQWPGNLVQWGIIKFRSKLQLQHRVCYQRHQYTYLSDKWSMVWKRTHMWKWEHF